MSNSNSLIRRRFSVAPMVGVTTLEHRYMSRLMSERATLYTEMVVDDVLIYAKKEVTSRILTPGAKENVVLQVASRDPEKFLACAQMAERAGFAEVNLNCGCPALTASRKSIGAKLMKEADLVEEILTLAAKNCNIPITVKCRLGVDDLDSFASVRAFVEKASRGLGHAKHAPRVIVHARKCMTLGLDPRKNRTVPPLNYSWVNDLSKTFPHVDFELNGGLMEMGDALAERHAEFSGGVMLGRLMRREPALLGLVDENFFGEKPTKTLTRLDVVRAYCERFQEATHHTELFEPIEPLFHGTEESKQFRRMLYDARSTRAGVPAEKLLEIVEKHVPERVLNENLHAPDPKPVREHREDEEEAEPETCCG